MGKKPKKTPKADKNDKTWSLSQINDTIDKSHKFLVLSRLHVAKTKQSVYEPLKQYSMDDTHLESEICVLDLDVPKRRLSLSSIVPGVHSMPSLLSPRSDPSGAY